MLFTLGRQRVLDVNGDPVINAKVSFFLTQTTTPATVYADAALTTPLTQPVRTDGYGYLPPIYYPSTLLKAVITDENDGALPDGVVDPINDTGIQKTTAEIADGITIIDFSKDPYDMRRYFGGSETEDSSSVFNAVIAMCVAQDVREIRAPGKWTINNPILIDDVLNQGLWIYIDELVAGTTGTWASAPADWMDGTAMIKVGTSSNGAPININVIIGSIRGNNRKADGILIGGGSYGCGLSYFRVDDVQDMNVYAKIDGAIWPTASNKFAGNSLLNCNVGFFLRNTAAHCEGTIVEYNFIWHCDYGGILAYRGSQYLSADGTEFDFSGEKVTELEVAGFSTFAIGDTVTGVTSGTTGRVIGIYNFQNANFILVTDPAKAVDAVSSFTTETIQAGAASTSVIDNRSANVASSNFYFDIVLSAKEQSFHRANIRAPYLGGIVGAWLHTCIIEGANSANSLMAQITGLGITHSGTELTLYDRAAGNRILDVNASVFAPYRDIFLNADSGNYRLYSRETAVPLTTAVAATVFTMPALTNGSQWLFNCSQATDNALRAGGTITVTDAGAVVYDSDYATGLTISVSGADIQALHGSGGVKTIRATLLRVR